MKDKYGFKTSSLEEHINKMQIDYNNSKVVPNAHRYLPSYKKYTTQNTSISDLFKETRTQSQKREDELKEQLRSMQNRKVSKEMLMSAEEKQLLSNANTLTQLFNENRYAFVSSLDNAQCKQVEIKYSTSGEYFSNIDDTSVYLNKISKIEQVDYVPASVMKKSNYMYKHTTYNLYNKHADKTDILVARVVFAN